MSNFDDLVSDVMTRVTGAPLTTATLLVTNALREFYVHSASYIRDSQPISILETKVDYVIPQQPGGDVLYIYGGKVGDGNYIRIGLAASRMAGTTSTSISRFWSPTPGSIRVEPVPSNDFDDPLVLSLALRPTSLADVSDEVFPYHYDVVIDGAIGRAYMMPDKPWTNVKTATYHLQRFRNGMASARDVARRKYTSADTPVTFPPWA